ncbi:iron-sulfur cluster assembly protein [Acidocella aminolytica]|uniref:MIP18 family-like domain-containing protein n=1 Tax=Acidocella aminolytica 101 = DSM 11237 TaxID=1120923 RepID=A0A0D6PK39_9PROT|nr:iron-sulfur cluster assembly protein [Acidocella aminolytica]GAN81119.1 hypothetical protein Aam_076_024 [Acidocella aminolytica 101 = DSM 11237]GBQ37410.1 hypothetical protein AA11237_1518 [Acidocella aminolytica 101 = DSM 11237]SHF48279.1 Metal-sulfur cluster biosynthetic enzyme [Acidocella aminolytica 101 = DSM 11237]
MTSAKAPRIAAVMARLAHVTDPELDESVVRLGFITGIEIDEQAVVSVYFRLPTYWCSANFAWIMAEDMIQAVTTLAWVKQVRPVLDEHMFASQINQAMAGTRDFRTAFGAEAEGSSLDEVRRTFARKAFGRRQLALVERLLADGWTAPAILALRVQDLNDLSQIDLVWPYLEKRAVPGPFLSTDPAFIGADGATVTPERLAVHLNTLRGVVVNMEFNGALCRGLLAARYEEEEAIPPARDSQPQLIDFIRTTRQRG